MKIEYFSRGGQFPYQAEGKIEDFYFYFRARHEKLSLELYKTKKDLDEMENIVCSTSKFGVSFIPDNIAEEEIIKLYNIMINE